MWIELPGRIDLPAIRSSGVSPEALQRHYVFVTEYLWGVVETDFENGQAVTVLDVQGLGMRDLAGEALGFVKVGFVYVRRSYSLYTRLVAIRNLLFPSAVAAAVDGCVSCRVCQVSAAGEHLTSADGALLSNAEAYY